MRLLRQGLDIEAIVKDGIARTHLKHSLNDVSYGMGWISMVKAIPIIVTALVVRSWRPLGDQILVMLCQYFRSKGARRDNGAGNRNTNNYIISSDRDVRRR